MMLRMMLWVAVLGFCCSVASAEDVHCGSDFAKIKQDIMSADGFTDEKRKKYLDALDKVEQHCAAGNAEEAKKHVDEIDTEEIYDEAFQKADT